MKYNEIMKRRGFHLHHFESNRKSFSYLHDEEKVWCQITEKENDTASFEFKFIIGPGFSLRSGSMGSLELDEHFNFFFEKFIGYKRKLEGE